jgi:hypothetical protein
LNESPAAKLALRAKRIGLYGVFSNLVLLVALVGNVVAFPLILAFSRREKEQPMFHFLKLVSVQAAFSRGFASTLGAFLPLPAGEGRGEGEQIVRSRF